MCRTGAQCDFVSARRLSFGGSVCSFSLVGQALAELRQKFYETPMPLEDSGPEYSHPDPESALRSIAAAKAASGSSSLQLTAVKELAPSHGSLPGYYGRNKQPNIARSNRQSHVSVSVWWAVDSAVQSRCLHFTHRLQLQQREALAHPPSHRRQKRRHRECYRPRQLEWHHRPRSCRYQTTSGEHGFLAGSSVECAVTRRGQRDAGAGILDAK